VRRIKTGAQTVAIALAAALAAVLVLAPAGVANADICGGFGPGIPGPGLCGPPNNDGASDASQTDTSWPPGMDYFSGGGGGNTPATPIVPVAP
jgi:hypothetical protein